jgi:DNA-binding transcriptional ArsR family regulator
LTIKLIVKSGLLFLLICLVQLSFAQDSSKIDKALSLPDKFFGALDKKTSSIESKLDKQTDKYVHKLEKQESKLKKKLNGKDSVLAKQLFDGTEEKYEQLKSQVKTSTAKINKYQSVYSGHLDSLSTALNFLKGNNITGNPALAKTLAHYGDLQSKFDASEQLKNYIAERRQLLKQQLEGLGMVKELRQFRKQVYYYQAQLNEYREAFNDPNKIEAKLMELIWKVPTFKDFFAKYSRLGSLFPLPSGNSNSSSSVSFASLQTRATLNQSLISRFGTSTAVTQQLQQNIQSAQGQINALKSKLGSLSSGSFGNSDAAEIPGFKPNSQKTKSLFERLEYGADVQSQRARYFFPVTSDIALSLGYKLNDKSSVGVGASYKLGWGNNWNHIRISHQGIGLRSYMDWKIKGSLYVSGGYEQNYRNLINSVDQLKDYSAWQNSGLIGLSKKYNAGKKMKAQMKILWDFMSYRQIPKSQPILFRVGYSFK